MNNKLKLLYAGLILLAIFTLWPKNEEQKPASIHVWNAHIDDNGHLNVLGVVLGQSNLKQAETALHSQSERALFVEVKNGNIEKDTIEAFFPTSPDRAKIILELDASDELMERIKERAYKPMAFPSGNVKLEIAPEQTAEIEALVAKSLTYIPSVSLDPAHVEEQFGKPFDQLTDIDNNLHMLYPALGLDAVIQTKDKKALLQFVPPNEYHRLLKLIKVALPATKDNQ